MEKRKLTPEDEKIMYLWRNATEDAKQEALRLLKSGIEGSEDHGKSKEE